MIKRRDPSQALADIPCSMVAVGTATGALPDKPAGLRPDGYLSLECMNRYVRAHLPIKRKVQYPRAVRPTLKDFLEANTEKCVVCCLGHYVYADQNTYWSFLHNAKDPVVAVWYLWR